MELYEAVRVCSTSSVTPIFSKKNINSAEYGVILHKDINNPMIQIQANQSGQEDNDDLHLSRFQV